MTSALGPIGILVRFSRLVSESPALAEILARLGEAVHDHLEADGVAVLRITAAGDLEIAAAQRLPAAVQGFRASADIIGPELGGQLLQVCGGAFAQARTLPLVSSGGLFGALVIFYAGEHDLSTEQQALAEGLTDLAAIAFSQASQYDALARSYAELSASREILTRGEKLRALGQMASGVSHDLRNLLSPLLMQVQLLRRMGPEEQEERDETLQRMEQVLWRGVELVERLRSFSRQTPDLPASRQDLNGLVAEALNLSRPRMNTQQVQLSQALGDPPQVRVNGGEFLSVLLNLLVNALDVLPTGGRIRVESGARDGGAFVSVADDGPGFPKEVEKHLFEPFFTTKGDKGTGLGLSTVYAFAQRHGGAICAESPPEGGARFTLWLPAST